MAALSPAVTKAPMQTLAGRNTGHPIETASPLRQRAKRLVEWYSDSIVLPIHRRLNPSPSIVLVYHNIVPDDWAGGGDASGHLRHTNFTDQLNALVRTHDVLPLEALLQPPGPRCMRPRAAITFDDAYAGALTIGLTELVHRRLPATVFVAPGYIGGKTFWWDDLADRVTGLQESTRTFALQKLGGDDRSVRKWAERHHRSITRVTPEGRGCELNHLKSAVATGLVTLAAHSWTHPVLPRVDDQRLIDELVAPLEWLREEFGPAALPYLAYPYGLFDRRVVRAAREAGYTAAFAVSGGSLRHPIANRVHELPRVNVPAGISLSAFKRWSVGVSL
jgi:peptidoglycan/xylan/chitin deacetylase (PgdA/CDA1 family)